jgi:hypothetical protein
MPSDLDLAGQSRGHGLPTSEYTLSSKVSRVGVPIDILD